MRTRWIFWAGVGFIIAGFISFIITLGGQGPPSFIEELSGSSIGWIIIGAVLIVFSIIIKIKF